jgi:hypothetical protein
MHKGKEMEDPRFYDSEKIELITRVLVIPQFEKALEGRLEPGLLKSLKKVFFEYTYPTPPANDERA